MKGSAIGFIENISDAVRRFLHGVSHTSRAMKDASFSLADVRRFLQGVGYSTGVSARRAAPKWENKQVLMDFYEPNESRVSRLVSYFAKFSFSKGAAWLIAALIVAYILATQFTGAPNYRAAYDDSLPPKGPFGPVTIRKDKYDVGASGYGSKLVAVAAAAIEDELSRGWCPSESIFAPSSLRTDTCAFQLGKHQILADTIQAFKQQKIGYKGSPNDYAPDLVKASGNINFSANVWGVFYGSTSYFAEAVDNLRDYNSDLVEGKTGMNADLYKLDQLIEVFVEETEAEASALAELQGNDFLLIGSNRAAFAHAKGVFATVCELMKAFETDAFKVISDRNAWDSFDIAKSETCKASQINTPFFSLVGNIGINLQELKGGAQIAHARLSTARNALAAPSHQ